MIGWLSRFFARLFARGEPALSNATPRDAAALAKIHAASFRHGWSDGEFERFLMERNVVAQRATLGSSPVGFIISRIGGGEAEILSVAVVSSQRGRGLARRLLTSISDAWRALAFRRCFWRSTKTISRPGGYMPGPDFVRSDAGRVIIRKVRDKRRQR